MSFITQEAFENHLNYILEAPRDEGILKMIVIRPETNQREILDSCYLSLREGAQGDNWAKGCWKSLPDGSPHPDVQLTLMNYRVLEVIEKSPDRRALAGDNLCVDLDLSENNLQAGDRLSIGEAILVITKIPHNGCKKFKGRYGEAALSTINSPRGKELHLRGIYARVEKDGYVRVGDRIKKV